MLSVKAAGLTGRIFMETLQVAPGDCIVVCGPNGGGKSSLLRLLAGLDRPQRGEVRLLGRSLRRLPNTAIAEHVAWLPQRADAHQPMRTEEIVAAGRFRFHESPERALEAARSLMRERELGSLVGRWSSEISGGELQRVLIASLVAQETSLLLVDEPANHLDPKHQLEAYRHLGRLWREGKGLVIVSHDVRLAKVLGPAEEVRVLGVKDGKVEFDRSLADPQMAEHLMQLYGVAFVPAGGQGALSLRLPQAAETS